MEKLPCSIFNDVIGPVMRGPSSSHVAGGARIADLVRQSMSDRVVRAVVDFDVNGCLPGTVIGLGRSLGLAAGAAVQMMGGDIVQCMDAASVALQNITGLACDPVGNRVEVPCLGNTPTAREILKKTERHFR